MLKIVSFVWLVVFGLFAAAGPAHASLVPFRSFVGNYGVSTSGWGSLTQTGTITAKVPVGATVTAAYLYTTLHLPVSWLPVGSAGGTFGGRQILYSFVEGGGYFSTGRADVTSIVAPIIDAGTTGSYSFPITEKHYAQDGSALVVVYRKADLPFSTVVIADGVAEPSGDSVTLNFDVPLAPSAPGFFAELRLGIGYSCCQTQFSNVRVNGSLISAAAGNSDDNVDSSVFNGNLITVGGSDDPFSPILPSYEQDRERYNIVPQIANGSKSITIVTQNESGDDSIFLAVVHAAGAASVAGLPKTLPENVSCASNLLDRLTPPAIIGIAQKNLMRAVLNTSLLYADGYPSLALKLLDSVIARVDGCSARGTPDPISQGGAGIDFVTSCADQAPILACLKDAQAQLLRPAPTR